MLFMLNPSGIFIFAPFLINPARVKYE